MISNLQMITIYVRDMVRAVEFYIEKLGFEKVAEYNDGKDNYLTWVMPPPVNKDDLATQIAFHNGTGTPRLWERSRRPGSSFCGPRWE
jgi:catechol 2,3-dioxygenase-like lactoylglutathione lyase family enzyme